MLNIRPEPFFIQVIFAFMGWWAGCERCFELSVCKLMFIMQNGYFVRCIDVSLLTRYGVKREMLFYG